MAAFYVSTTGSDSNPGTLGAPWRTIQKAASTVTAGSIVYIRGGVYSETIEVTVSGSAAGGYITFQSYPGETAIIDGSSITPSGGEFVVILMENRSYLRWQGLEIRNFRTATQNIEINAIAVYGTSHHIELISNKIHHIEINVTASTGGNGHGILIVGNNGSTSITNVVIDRNEVYNLRTGFSESITLNGNVDGFQVTNNTVHDCNNIAIDMAGHYGACPNAAVDQARNGYVAGNYVYNIDSSYNPAYGGNFTSGGGGHSADGIYVDGGTNIIIERNRVYRANIGIEMASEHSGKSTSFITVRSNIVIESSTYGIAIGGYDTNRGSTTDCKILNNTLLNNGTLSGNSDIEVQFDTRNNVFKNNIIYGNTLGYFIHNPYTQNTNNVVDYNLYFATNGAASARFLWKNVDYGGFTAYKAGSGNDAHSIWADPQFVNKSALDLHLLATSPAISAGDNSVIGIADTDIDNQLRKQGAAVEMGADEISSGAIPLIEAVGLTESIVTRSSRVSGTSVALNETLSVTESVVATRTAGTVSPSPVTPPTPTPPPAPPPPPAPVLTPPLPTAWVPIPAPVSVPSRSPYLPADTYPGPRVSHYDPLGGGLVRPFVRAVHGDFASDQGVALVLSNLGQIFGTEKKTLPWRPAFGSSLERLRHRANTPALRELAMVYVRDGLSEWEPRVQLKRLSVEVGAPNEVKIHAVVAITGATSDQTLRFNAGGGLRASTASEPLSYSTVTPTRVIRGLAQFASPLPYERPQQRVAHLPRALLRPIRRARDFLNGSGVEEILSNIGQVLGTEPGTLPWNPAYGCSMTSLRHKSNTPALRATAAFRVTEALKKWEPRAEATKVDVIVPSASSNQIIIRTACKISVSGGAGTYDFDVAVR